jgi:hypothetical protein
MLARSARAPSVISGGKAVYRLKLDLSGYDAGSVVLSGGWSSDNSAELVINGISTGVKQAGFTALPTFRIGGVFKSGVNDIDFKVANGDATGGPTGLRVEGLLAVGVKSGGQPPVTGPGPALAFSRSGANLTLSRPAPSTGFVLESATSVTGPWAAGNAAPTTAGGVQSVTLPLTDTMRFYRLRK